MKNRFDYRIYSNVYDAMISGKKNIEIRLLNEKSERIQKGDEIEFIVTDSQKHLLVEVTNKYIFDDVDELWLHKDMVLSSTIDYTKEEVVDKLYEIFGKEKVQESKLVGIEFRIKEY